MDSTYFSILIAAIIAVLLLCLAHFISSVLWGEIGRLRSYVAGTALIGVVFTGWCAYWELWVPVVAFWSIVAAAGFGTGVGHWIDDRVNQRKDNEAQKVELKLLQEQLNGKHK